MERDWYAVVRSEVCPDCALDAGSVPRAELGSRLVASGDQWRTFVLVEDDTVLRERTRPDEWSALEYACHVSDVLDVFAERISLAVRKPHPTFGWWDHEEGAASGRYGRRVPAEVADELAGRAVVLARGLDGLDVPGWSRTATRRPGEEFTVDGLARFALHESHHHLADARRVAESAATP